MVNENQLEDTSDSIMPIKNCLGIPSEMFTEIIQEFKRACKSKGIDRHLLVHYMENKSSWQIKCIAIGSVSNIVISMGPESDQYLSQLQSIGDDLVVDEVIRISIGDSNANLGDRNLSKKSTHKMPNVKSVPVGKKDSQGNISRPLEYHSAKSGSNVWLLSILAIISVALAVVFFVLFQNPNKKETVSKPVTIASPSKDPKVESKNLVSELPEVKEKVNQNIQVEHKKESAYTGSMVTPEGVLVYQNGYDCFIGGEMASLFSHKRKSNTSPFFVGNHTGVSYTLIKYDLRNIPFGASIENALINLNVTTLNVNNNVFNLYCLPVTSDWTYNSIFFNKEGSASELSFDGMIKNMSLAKKVSINLRNDWVSFNITSIVQEWISKKSENNGIVFFTDSDAEIIFEGFDSYKKMISPKLVITFGQPKPKPEEAKPVVENKSNEKEAEALIAKANAQKMETKPKETVVPILDKEKAEDNESNDNLLKNILDKVEEEKPVDKKEEKKQVKNVFEEDPNTPTKEKENVVKTKPINGVVPKVVEKVDVPKEESADITMKEPVILPISRLLDTKDVVKLENPENKGELRYTLDGKEPNADSLVYDEPIKLSGSQLHVVKSAVFLDHVRKSPIKVQEFRILGNLSQIIDNQSSNCKKSGDWESSNSKPNAYGKDYLWEQKGKGTVEWFPSLNKKSVCEVYVWLPDGDFLRPNKAKYVVKCEGGPKEVFVDQTARGTKWIYLGSFTMKAGAGSVTLQDDGSGKMFVADAICFYVLPEPAANKN